jgi:hypothetical protein
MTGHSLFGLAGSLREEIHDVCPSTLRTFGGNSTSFEPGPSEARLACACFKLALVVLLGRGHAV